MGRVGETGLFVPFAHDRQREARAGAGDATVGLEQCRPRVARQRSQPAAAWPGPIAPRHSVAPQAGPRLGRYRPELLAGNCGGLCRGRPWTGCLGICRAGHVAERRDPDAGPVVPRSGGLRERHRRAENRYVPYPNNVSERHLRPSVIFRKVTNGFTASGAPRLTPHSAPSSAPQRRIRLSYLVSVAPSSAPNYPGSLAHTRDEQLP